MHLHVLHLPIFSREKPQSGSLFIGGVSIFFLLLSQSTFPALGKQLASVFSPVSMLFVSELMGGLFILLSFGLVPIARAFFKMKRRTTKYLLLHGLLTGVIAPFLWFTGLQFTTSVNGQLFGRTEMLFLIVLSVMVLREKIDLRRWIAIGIITVGVLFVALSGADGLTIQPGDLAVVGSSLFYTIGAILIKKYLSDVPPELIIFTRAFCASSLFFLTAPFIRHTFVTELGVLPQQLVVVLLSYGFITKFLGTYSFHEAIDHLQVSTVSLWGTLSIVGGLAFSAYYLGESIEPHQIIGASCILGGILLMQTQGGHHPSEEVHETLLRQHPQHQV